MADPTEPAPSRGDARLRAITEQEQKIAAAKALLEALKGDLVAIESEPHAPVGLPLAAPLQTPMAAMDKVALFRRLFRGRESVFPVRWTNAKGNAGYSPACSNKFVRGVCELPRSSVVNV